MSKAFFQEASHAASYALYRPTYTSDVANVIVGKLRKTLPVQDKWDRLLDVGCGSGQSTRLFMPHFRRILAIDTSSNQIAEAKKKLAASAAGQVRFEVGVAEDFAGVDSCSLDLIVAGQAAHWFDLPKFLSECSRTLVPGGLVALFGYSTPRISASRATQPQVGKNSLNDDSWSFTMSCIGPPIESTSRRVMKNYS